MTRLACKRHSLAPSLERRSGITPIALAQDAGDGRMIF